LELRLNRHNNPNPNGYEDLTPTNDGDKDRKYSIALEWALKNENIKNIALTGAYGSGKSSILRTFEKEHRGYTYLYFSRAKIVRCK
jgi:DNA replication protein DnaC